MPLFLLDTNAVSDFMRGNPTLASKVSASTDPVVTSVIVRGEILQGIERLPAGRRRSQLEVLATAVLAMLPCKTLTVRDAEGYALVKTQVERLGFSMDENDLWIAAATMTLGATLVSRDADFCRIPGVIVEDWSV
jgi:predicted nucleic acid-binding protein